MKLAPLGAMVVIRPSPPPQTPGLIVPVRLETEAAVRGEVLSVGPEVRDAKPGDRVIFSRLQGFAVEIGDPVILINEHAILATE